MGGKHALPAADTSYWVEIFSPGKLGRVKTHFYPVNTENSARVAHSQDGVVYTGLHIELVLMIVAIGFL